MIIKGYDLFERNDHVGSIFQKETQELFEISRNKIEFEETMKKINMIKHIMFTS